MNTSFYLASDEPLNFPELPIPHHVVFMLHEELGSLLGLDLIKIYRVLLSRAELIDLNCLRIYSALAPEIRAEIIDYYLSVIHLMILKELSQQQRWPKNIVFNIASAINKKDDIEGIDNIEEPEAFYRQLIKNVFYEIIHEEPTYEISS